MLDTLGSVLTALQWILGQIVATWEKVRAWLQAIFAWDDIERTKNVLHTMIKLGMQNAVMQMFQLQSNFDEKISSAQQVINNWAGITSWSGIGEVSQSPVNAQTADPSGGQTSDSQLLSSHFKNHASNADVDDTDLSLSDVLQQLLSDLMDAFDKESQVFIVAINQLQQLGNDFNSLNLETILKRLVGILSDILMSSIRNVVDVVLRVFIDVSEIIFRLLDAPIHVPIISDILNTIGVEDVSVLDILCWIAAMAYTIPYRIVHNGTAPFPDNDDTRVLLNMKIPLALPASAATLASTPIGIVEDSTATTTDDNSTKQSIPTKVIDFGSDAVQSQTAATINVGVQLKALYDLIQSQPTAVKHDVFHMCHTCSAVLGALLSPILALEAMEDNSQTTLNKVATPINITIAAAIFVADLFESYEGIDNGAVKAASIGWSAVHIFTSIFCSGTFQNLWETKVKRSIWDDPPFSGTRDTDAEARTNDQMRVRGSAIKAGFSLPSLFFIAWHFYELSTKPASNEKGIAVTAATGDVAGILAEISYAVTVSFKDPESKAIAAAVYCACLEVAAGCQAAEVLIDDVN